MDLECFYGMGVYVTLVVFEVLLRIFSQEI